MARQVKSRVALEGLRLELHGQVQGLGVRPALARLARELGLAGVAANSSAGVVIELAGPPGAVTEFAAEFPRRLPSGARLESWSRRPLARQVARRWAAGGKFLIGAPDERVGLAAPVPRDRAICPDCLAEVVASDDPRRSGYPFVSCTACGPRYALLKAMPYDRRHTSLADFPLCTACAAEFAAPSDRRFHAETNACALCGPRVRLVDRQGRLVGGPWRARVAAALAAGQIVALLGVGGYQLLCDATNSGAVRELRRRKGRPTKPLAVLVADLAMAEGVARLDDAHRAALTDPANPIVLAPPRPRRDLARDELLAGLGEIGLLLPTTALHALVARDFGRPLVCTSGNREGEPLAYCPETADGELGDLADLRLDHDRAVRQPIDDSLVRIVAGRTLTLRLGRGLGPLPLELPDWRNGRSPAAPCLAVGGQQKNALAWWNGEQAALGPHIGDLDTMAARARLAERVDAWQDLYRFRPRHIVCDAHPDYVSTRYAEDRGLPLARVQHHRAHVAAVCAEHGLERRDVAGVAWDGTGYGDDGTIWGGEFFRGPFDNLVRVGRLRPFRLAGGEAAIREPARVALALLAEIDESPVGTTLARELEPAWIAQVERVLALPRLAPVTSSAGRLFDGLAALVLGSEVGGFEGRPAMLLEAIADPLAVGSYTLDWSRAAEPVVAELDWRPLVREVVCDLRRGQPAEHVAMRIHRALAAAIADWGVRQAGCPLVLGGGVFQNRWLTELVLAQWRDCGRSEPVRWSRAIPPNDGGLAAGQLVLGLALGLAAAGQNSEEAW